VLEWEYLKIDLNQRGAREDELDLLNRAGADRWELVGISATNIAYLKRSVDETTSPVVRNGQHPALPINATEDEWETRVTRSLSSIATLVPATHGRDAGAWRVG
jgi:hypothetical protein